MAAVGDRFAGKTSPNFNPHEGVIDFSQSVASVARASTEHLKTVNFLVNWQTENQLMIPF